MEIKINITGNRAVTVDEPTIVCGNSDYIIRFSFDEEWAGFTAKTARFVYFQNGKVLYQDVVFTGDTVRVPILLDISEVRIGVYTENLRTTSPAWIRCEPSIRCGTGAPAEPEPSQYDQLIQLINGVAAGADEIRVELDRQSEEILAEVDKRYVVAGRLEGSTLGENATAEGKNTTASGGKAHAEGVATQATGENSHAEGNSTTAAGKNGHAEGAHTRAASGNCHAEGYYTKASGDNAHAEGWYSEATGINAHAEGRKTIASGRNAHAGGNETVASGENQTAIGQYNEEDSNALLIVGNGTGDGSRKNAFTVGRDGTATVGKDPVKPMDVATKGYVDKFVQFVEILYAPDSKTAYCITAYDKIFEKLEKSIPVFGVLCSVTLKDIYKKEVKRVFSLISCNDSGKLFVKFDSPVYSLTLSCTEGSRWVKV